MPTAIGALELDMALGKTVVHVQRPEGCLQASLLACALLSDQTLIWTVDKRLESVAAEANRA